MIYSPLFCGSPQPIQINFIDLRCGICLLLQKHEHIHRQIHDPPIHLYVVVLEHIGHRYRIIRVAHHVVQCGVAGVVLAGLDLDRQHVAILFHDEIQLPLLLAVEIIELEAIYMAASSPTSERNSLKRFALLFSISGTVGSVTQKVGSATPAFLSQRKLF